MRVQRLDHAVQGRAGQPVGVGLISVDIIRPHDIEHCAEIRRIAVETALRLKNPRRMQIRHGDPEQEAANRAIDDDPEAHEHISTVRIRGCL